MTAPTKPRSKRADAASGKRDLILDAAAAVFAEGDFHRATIKAIAQRAGIADGTVYNHFANKDALVVALLERFTEDAAVNLPPDMRLEDSLNAVTRERFALLSPEALHLFRAVLPEVIANPGLRALFRAQVLEPGGDEAATLERLGGSLPREQLRLHLKLHAAFVLGVVVLRLLDDPDLEQHWDELPALLEGFVGGAR